jgi:hypothetical protein
MDFETKHKITRMAEAIFQSRIDGVEPSTMSDVELKLEASFAFRAANIFLQKQREEFGPTEEEMRHDHDFREYGE